MDMTGLAFGKPAKRPKSKPSKAYYRNGKLERIVLSDADWKKLTQWAWETQLKINGLVRCHIGKHTVNYRCDFVLDHPLGRGMNAAHRDDREVLPACHSCNGIKGSKRMI